jgi:Leucine-rich repeat (LRR) protein
LDLSTIAVKSSTDGTHTTRLADKYKVFLQIETVRDRIEYRLTEIPQEVFVLNILTELWLCHNSLTEIPIDIVSLECLQILSFAHNLLTFLPVELLTLKFLKKLILNGNKLSSLPDRFGELKCLEELELGSNFFTSIPPVVYNDCTQLVNMDFSKNLITEIPIDFADMRSLTFLNLEKNKITIPPEVFKFMGWLDIKGCPLPQYNKLFSNTFIISEYDFDVGIGEFIKSRANAKLNPKKKKRKSRQSRQF